jgi:Domain of unknown function (DUF4145)
VQDPDFNVTVAVDCELWDIIGRSLAILWKDWPKDMELSSYQPDGFVINGECPHCRKQAAFPTVTSISEDPRHERKIAAARCIACNEYILAIIKFQQLSSSGGRFVYDVHYPIGWPDDTVADEIPPAIKPDFQEALRCRWVKAYNATVEMCRRALESSCIQLGADSDLVLAKMIDWVHAQGKITTPLKDMAHKIKLGGNRAAHPSDRTITEGDADAVIEFTGEYFQHVYVMPARMAKFDFDKKKK